MVGPALVEIASADPPSAWEGLGFAVRDGATRIGTTTIRLGAPGAGLTGWTLAGEGAGDLDGVATAWVGALTDAGPAPEHPNGALLVDHVVLTTPDLQRTLAALAATGLDLRRTRDAGKLLQAFFRMGEVILEVVGPPEPSGDDPAALWGLVVVVSDLDGCAQRMGENLGTPRDAVQPGRRIATVRPSSGVSVPLALMTPDRVGG